VFLCRYHLVRYDMNLCFSRPKVSWSVYTATVSGLIGFSLNRLNEVSDGPMSETGVLLISDSLRRSLWYRK